MPRPQAKKGFTLIELLVVIAIISLLSSVVLASLNSARESARDTRRASDVNQLQTALEMYHNDNGKYPQVSGWAQDCSGNNSWDNKLGLKLDDYMSSLPHDPLYPDNPWALCYYYKDGGYSCCPNSSGEPYTILYGTETTGVGPNNYTCGMGAAKARHCVHP